MTVSTVQATARPVKHKPVGAKRVVAHKQAPSPSSPSVPGENYIRSLTPVDSGPGVVVTEPLMQNADDAAAFGAGCSRWLQFELAGTSALGKTPLLDEIDRARREMAKPDLRLSVAEAEQIGRLLGVTHVAVGSITGASGHHVLNYRLWSVKTGAASGAEISRTGSDDQIVAALPDVGRQICSELGVTSAQIPAGVGATAEEISQVGRAVWVTTAPFTTSPPGPLLALSQRLPVAGLWLLGGGLLQDDEQRQALVKTLLTSAPHNPLAYCEIVHHGPDLLIPYQDALEREWKQSPNNYLLAQADAWLQEGLGDETAACRAAEQAVRSFPDSPDAWLTLAAPIGDAAQALRRGRTADRITEAEWASLGVAYAEWQATAAKATVLDPGLGKSWMRLATAATFSGDRNTADAAFWKAVQLDQDEREKVYYWGMEMYQPKWNDDEKKLVKVVQMAAEAHYDNIGEIIAIADEIRRLGLDDVAGAMMTQIIAARQAASQADPKDPQPHIDLALALRGQNRLADATTEMQSFIAIVPRSGEAHFLLGQLWSQQNKWDMAVSEFREANRLKPCKGEWHEELGRALMLTSQSVDAEKEFREAVRLTPRSATAHRYLSLTLGPDQTKESIAQLQEALRINPDYISALFALSQMYAQQGEYAAAIAVGERTVSLAPKDVGAHLELAQDYDKLGDYTRAESEYRTLLGLMPKDMMLHQNLGDTLLALGKIAGARAEWEQVVEAFSVSNPSAADKARKQLEQHPTPGPHK